MKLSLFLRWVQLVPLLAAASASAQPNATPGAVVDDPYLWLEPFDSAPVMEWVRAENAKTLAVMTQDPRFESLHEQALAIVQNRDRLPMPQQIGGMVYNFWRDAQHVRGIWRVTTQVDYDAGGTPAWTTVLDLDQLSIDENANWIWKGADCESRAQRRCLLLLSDGGEDAVSAREFDLTTRRFVTGGFALPKGKQRTAWLDADTLLVAREWNPGELTTSSYPYIVKRVRRGQPLSAAAEVFRGRKDDGGYGVTPQVLLDAQGRRAALIVRPLSTFEFEHYLVTAAGPRRLAMPRKTDVAALFDGQLIVRLRESAFLGRYLTAAAKSRTGVLTLTPRVACAPSSDWSASRLRDITTVSPMTLPTTEPPNSDTNTPFQPSSAPTSASNIPSPRPSPSRLRIRK